MEHDRRVQASSVDPSNINIQPEVHEPVVPPLPDAPPGSSGAACLAEEDVAQIPARRPMSQLEQPTCVEHPVVTHQQQQQLPIPSPPRTETSSTNLWQLTVTAAAASHTTSQLPVAPERSLEEAREHEHLQQAPPAPVARSDGLQHSQGAQAPLFFPVPEPCKPANAGGRCAITRGNLLPPQSMRPPTTAAAASQNIPSARISASTRASDTAEGAGPALLEDSTVPAAEPSGTGSSAYQSTYEPNTSLSEVRNPALPSPFIVLFSAAHFQ